MYAETQQRAAALVSEFDSNPFLARQVGLEKETLRIDTEGRIAQTNHPAALGSALCNGAVTTDFSESLLEMVTPPCDSAKAAFDYLTGLHQFILPRLEHDEGLWNTSMPCILNGEDSIRIGEYGKSHNGIMKHVYRRGLGLRYGRRMQAIAGIHFNFSLPDSVWPVWQQLHSGANDKQASNTSSQSLSTDGYFHMTCNLMRIGWIVPFLFGASPAICQTFLPSGADSDLHTLNKHTRFAPHGTSLRMGEIGYRYKEDAPIDLTVRHECFEQYIQDILQHVSTSHPPYQELGLKDDDGLYQQLSTNKLQIENEYYSSVRPKQIPKKGEMPILALQRKGIRYLELRSVDVNVFEPAGMRLEQIAMLEMLMLFAWISDNEPLTAVQMSENKHNIQVVAHRGREPGLKLQRNGDAVSLLDWGQHIFESLQGIAQWLDISNQGDMPKDLYQNSLQRQMAKLADTSLTPSARVVGELPDHGSFFQLAMTHSAAHKDTLMNLPVDAALQSTLEKIATESVQAQQNLERSCEGSFDEFLKNYYSQLSSR